ncbi:hypothetical protein R3P38DRAFT_2832730 [Favolaschia claudopus]|uniref:Transmembrane protein n=1 Tax=Favolaschia claudopus TaxID=2862362 RepID=A0AAW0E9S7_9AGAR
MYSSSNSCAKHSHRVDPNKQRVSYPLPNLFLRSFLLPDRHDHSQLKSIPTMYSLLVFILYLLPFSKSSLSIRLYAAPTSIDQKGASNVPSLAQTLSRSLNANGVAGGAATAVATASAHTSTSNTRSATHKPTAASAGRNPPHTTGAGQITARPGSTSTHSFVLNPGPTPSHFHRPPPSDPHRNNNNNTSTTGLVFEILGALAGVAFFFGVARCIYSYRRTPSHDRITSILHRHQLQREMEELERNPPQRQSSLREPPPPPYIAPPPSYPVDEHTPLSNRDSSGSYDEPPSPPHTATAFRPNG